jgi:hypothetical protein
LVKAIFSAVQAFSSSMASRGLTGSAIDTCATQPGPKKLFSRAKVRSMNWSDQHEVSGRQFLLQ